METGTTRRDLLLTGLAAAIATAGAGGFPARLYAQAKVTQEEFLELSKQLTGASRLDSRVAEQLLGGFLEMGQGPDLADLVAEMPAPDPASELADTIVAAWYSGVYATPEGLAVADYTGALVWNALAFTKPAGYCGGATNYWSEPPESEQ